MKSFIHNETITITVMRNGVITEDNLTSLELQVTYPIMEI